MRARLDADFGGAPKGRISANARSRSLLLGWADVEIVGITTNLEVGT